MTRVLIVEDEGRIASFIEKGLRADGFTPTVVSDGRTALNYALSGEFDLVVLDLGLPLMDGFAVLTSMRKAGCSTPVVVLTGRASVRDTVAALQGGADDYITKPFRYEELLARIRLRSRTSHLVEETVLRCGVLSLDLRTRRVSVDGRVADLTARELLLVETFMRNAGQVLSREQLLSQVWGYDFDPRSNIVDVYVRHLRDKLGRDRIETVRGMGYRLVG